MKIYRHEFDYRAKRVKTTEFEVEEKPKSYKFLEPSYISSIRKSQMGVIDYDRMYTTTPNPRGFLLARIAKKEESLAYYSGIVENLQKDIDWTKIILAEMKTT